jgi:hypothetical protein
VTGTLVGTLQTFLRKRLLMDRCRSWRGGCMLSCSIRGLISYHHVGEAGRLDGWNLIVRRKTVEKALRTASGKTTMMLRNVVIRLLQLPLRRLLIVCFL